MSDGALVRKARSLAKQIRYMTSAGNHAYVGRADADVVDALAAEVEQLRGNLEAARRGADSFWEREAHLLREEVEQLREERDVLAAYAGIGTEMPPDHVFRAFQRLHGLPEIGRPPSFSTYRPDR